VRKGSLEGVLREQAGRLELVSLGEANACVLANIGHEVKCDAELFGGLLTARATSKRRVDRQTILGKGGEANVRAGI